MVKKPKNSKYRGKYKCDFCMFMTDELKKYKKHLKDAHGKYYKKSTRKKPHKLPEVPNKLIGNTLYGWDKRKKVFYELIKPREELENKESKPDIIEAEDGYRVNCVNCGKIHKFIMKPNLEEKPLILCVACNRNIFSPSKKKKIKKVDKNE